MSSSSLSVFALGVQGFSQLAAAATLAAERQTASLAGSQPTILATATKPTIGQTGPTRREQQFKAMADKACFVDKDPRMCSYWNQMLASSQAARTCAFVAPVAANARRSDSLAFHFRNPTWTSGVYKSTPDVSAVAVAMTAAKVPQPAV